MIYYTPLAMRCYFFFLKHNLIFRTHFILLRALEDVVESLCKVFGESRSKYIFLCPKLVSGLSYDRIDDV